MYQGRALLAGRKRLIRNVVGFFVLAWMVLKTNLVGACVTFCLSGVVPGTQYVVSAGLVVAVAGTAVGIMALRTVLRLRRSRVRRHTRAVREATQSARLQPSGRPVKRHMHASHYKQQRFPIVFRLRLAAAAAAQRLIDGLESSRLYSAEKLQAVSAWVLVGAAKSLLIAIIITGRIGQGSIRVLKLCGWLLIGLWRRAEPQLWQLDGWLEARVTYVQQRLVRWLNGYAATAVLLGMAKENSELFKKWRSGRWPMESAPVSEAVQAESHEQAE